MTHDELLAALCARFNVELSDSRTRSIFTSLLNDGYRWIWAQKAGKWKWNIARGALTITPTTTSITLPSDCRLVYHVKLRSTGAVLPKCAEDVAEVEGGAAAYVTRDYPQSWYQYDDTIYTYPLPGINDTLDILYFKKLVPLSASSDEPAFPEEFHPILVEHATAKYAGHDAFDPIVSSMARKDRDQLMVGMMHEDAKPAPRMRSTRIYRGRF